MIVFGPEDEKTRAVREMFERGDGVVRNLQAERLKYQRILEAESESSREYTQRYFTSKEQS